MHSKIKAKTFVICLLSCFFVSGCGNNGTRSPQNDGKPDIKSGAPTLPRITIEGIPLKVEIVQDVDSRAEGLMHRENLPQDQGMLFVFERTQMLSFWMRNTLIPLDIAFIDENGKIVDIQRMEPLDESKQYISSAPGLYALEVNAGWFEQHGIKVGDIVKF